MKDELIDKVEKAIHFFQDPYIDEKDDDIFFAQEICLTYIMVQLRKILERNKNKNKSDNYSLPEYCKDNNFDILLFFADWLLHTKKSRIGEKDEIVDVLRKVYKEIKNYRNFSTKKVIEGKLVSEFIEKETLKTQINRLMKQEEIENFLVQSKDGWRDFRRCLQEILVDQPIENKKGENISAVRFKSTSNKFNYFIRFECKDSENQKSDFVYMLGTL